MKEIIEYSINKKLKHLPSALSQYMYLKHVLPILKQDYNICIGKPFGSQAYYVPWIKMGYIKEDDDLSYGVKDKELDFVTYSEETLGNALGVASGVSMGSTKPTYCNISDGALQMGPTLEAIQFIGKHQQNILLNVDCNGFQLTGSTKDIMNQDIEYIINLFQSNNWRVFVNDIDRWSDNLWDIDQIISDQISFQSDMEKPIVQLFITQKGYGVAEMEKDPVGWHYKELKNINDVFVRNIK